jgi:site-specific DNA-methyltransferase (adenine-specific)
VILLIILKLIKIYTEKRFPSSIQYFNNRDADRGLHPTQKPVALLEYLIKTYTLEGEIVLDFTMGSGSTGVSCINLKRNFIGIEKDEKYFEIAKKRINDCQAIQKTT